jgi:DNA-binding NarL/FixJ family response regulator
MPRTHLLIGTPSSSGPGTPGSSGEAPPERLTAAEAAPAEERHPHRMDVALLDALPFRREAVQQMLQRCVPEHDVVCYASGEELRAALSGGARGIGLVVICTGGEPLSGTALGAGIRVLCDDLAPVPVVILSDREDDEDVVEACRIGVRGLLPTSLDPGVAREVLHLVAAGGSFLPAACLTRVLGGSGNGQRAIAGIVDPCGTAAVALTPRQQDVLALLCQGKPNKVIAHALGMEESTVKVHVRHLMRKLGASNRTEVLLRAQDLARAGESPGAPA